MRRLVAALCLLLTACTQAQWNDRLATPADRALALRTIAALRAGDANTLRQLVEPALFAQTVPQLPAARAIMNAPNAPELVTVNSASVTDETGTHQTTCLQFEYGAGRKWVFVQICLAHAGKPQRVNGWRAIPSETQPTAAGNFAFAGKSARHYAWLAAMIAVLATTLTACILAIRGRGIKRRWLWAIGSLVGFTQFSLSWTDGAWAFSPIYVSLFGAAAFRASPFNGWVLSFSLPVIAIIFLLRRKALRAPRAAAADVEPASSPD